MKGIIIMELNFYERFFLESYKEKKGYNVSDGYMGLVNGEYKHFASEADYNDYIDDEDD